MTWLSDAAVERLRSIADAADLPMPAGERYEILEPIARGGMGTVYRARDRELGRLVALKVLSEAAFDERAAERLRQEARVLARLEHPGIVPVHDVGVLEDGRLFYVMKLVVGPRLDEAAAGRPLTDRLRLFTRICEPVAFANARGIVHRDLKPENIMVGSFGEILVMDWGVAAVEPVENDQPESPVIAGTRAYMAPEQARGEAVDARADVYALGGILQFLLTGAPPDQARAAGPRALQAICRKARADAPDARYGSAQALAEDVDRFLAGDPVSASPESPFDRAARFARKHRAAIVLIAAYLILRATIAWLAP